MRIHAMLKPLCDTGYERFLVELRCPGSHSPSRSWADILRFRFLAGGGVGDLVAESGIVF